MKTILFNITTSQPEGAMRYGPYLVDGQPGPLPDHIVVTLDMPATTDDQIAEPSTEIDLETLEYRETWTVRDLTPQELAELNPVPPEVAAWRLRAVMKSHGFEEQISEFLNSLPEPTKTIAKEAWYFGTTIHRNSVTVSAFADALQLSNEQISAYFREANAIVV